jgi:tRNA G18 (ribose-2'-O)-methylase SpoU
MARAGIGTEIEGVHAVDAALKSGRVTTLLVEGSRLHKPDIDSLVRNAGAQGVPVEVVDDVRPMAVTAAPQGVVARARAIQPISIKDAVALSENPALLVLDHVEDLA